MSAFYFNPLMAGGNKKVNLNKPAAFSMCNLFVTTRKKNCSSFLQIDFTCYTCHKKLLVLISIYRRRKPSRGFMKGTPGLVIQCPKKKSLLLLF